MKGPLRLFMGCLAALAVLVAGGAHAQCESGSQLRGVNLAGAEFNSKAIPGRYGYDYIYPSAQDLSYFRDTGMSVIRLPFRWERIQPAINGALDSAELDRIRSVVDTARGLELCVLLDVHNYGAYAGQAIGSSAVPDAALADLWRRLAEVFANQPNVAFGLMNEPAALPIALWASIAQRTIDAIRTAGAANLVMVSGGRWSGAHEWEKTFGGTSNAEAFRDFRDSAGNFVFEVHQYANPSYSGTTTECISADSLRGIMRAATDWGRNNGHRFFLGEFGTASTEACLAALDAILGEMHGNEVWAGWTYWAAGRWWGTYPFSIQPTPTGPALQMSVIGKYL